MTDLTAAAAAFLAAINEAEALDTLDPVTDARLDRLHAAAEASAEARWSTISEDIAALGGVR